MTKEIVVIGNVEQKIYLIRSHRVMLDRDLADLYGVKPIALRQQVKRNKERFPDDFMFQLTEQEIEILVSQNVIPSRRELGGYNPYVFTEQGVAMLSSVLRSKRAIHVNLQIMRAFVRLRKLMLTHGELVTKLKALEGKVEKYNKKHDKEIAAIFEAIRQLMILPEKPRRRI